MIATQPATKSSIEYRNSAIRTSRIILDNPEKYLIIDTETTGFADMAEVVEFAALTPKREILAHHYFNPVQPIHPSASAVNGITPEFLAEKNALSWMDVSLSHLFTDRVITAYNVNFDVQMIENSDRFHGVNTIEDGCDRICIMRLYQQFTGDVRPEKLGGDHSALGDCMTLIDRLEEMAKAEFMDDPYFVEIEDINDLVVIQKQLKDLAAKRKSIEKDEKALKSQLVEFMLTNGHQTLPLHNGMQLKLAAGIVNVNAINDDIDAMYKKESLNLPVIKNHWINGDLPDDLFTFDESFTTRFTKM